MDATVIEFDALSDAVRATAQHHNFLLVCDDALILHLKRGVVVRGLRREFRCTRIHEFVGSNDAEVDAVRMHFGLKAIEHVGDLPVCVAFLFGFAQNHLRNRIQRVLADFFFQVNEFLNLAQEPGINFGDFADLPDRNAQLHGIVQVEQAVPTRVTQAIEDGVLVAELAAVAAQSIAADFQ